MQRATPRLCFLSSVRIILASSKEYSTYLFSSSPECKDTVESEIRAVNHRIQLEKHLTENSRVINTIDYINKQDVTPKNPAFLTNKDGIKLKELKAIPSMEDAPNSATAKQKCSPEKTTENLSKNKQVQKLAAYYSWYPKEVWDTQPIDENHMSVKAFRKALDRVPFNVAEWANEALSPVVHSQEKIHLDAEKTVKKLRAASSKIISDAPNSRLDTKSNQKIGQEVTQIGDTSRIHLEKTGPRYPQCELCLKEPATLRHILNRCKVALNQDRYTYRHNSVLSLLGKQIRESSCLNTLWLDLPNYGYIPAELKRVCNGLRPDGYVVFKDGSRAILEATCPWELRLPLMHASKHLKYQTACKLLEKKTGKHCELFCFEIGARGIASEACAHLKRLIPSNFEEALCAMSASALECSYEIWKYRSEPVWPHSIENRRQNSSKRIAEKTATQLLEPIEENLRPKKPSRSTGKDDSDFLYGDEALCMVTKTEEKHRRSSAYDRKSVDSGDKKAGERIIRASFHDPTGQALNKSLHDNEMPNSQESQEIGEKSDEHQQVPKQVVSRRAVDQDTEIASTSEKMNQNIEEPVVQKEVESVNGKYKNVAYGDEVLCFIPADNKAGLSFHKMLKKGSEIFSSVTVYVAGGTSDDSQEQEPTS